MTRALLSVVVAVLLVLFQSTLVQFLRVPALVPDLFLILVILLARFHGGIFPLVATFVGAIVLDSLSLRRLGYLMLIYLVLVFVIISFREKLYSYSLLSFFLLFFSVAVLKALYLTVIFLLGVQVYATQYLWALGVEACVSTAVSIPVYLVYRSVAARRGIVA